MRAVEDEEVAGPDTEATGHQRGDGWVVERVEAVGSHLPDMNQKNKQKMN